MLSLGKRVHASAGAAASDAAALLASDAGGTSMSVASALASLRSAPAAQWTSSASIEPSSQDCPLARLTQRMRLQVALVRCAELLRNALERLMDALARWQG